MSSKIKLNVKGKNIERFIERLYKNNIDILKIKYLNYNSIDIIIYYKDYEKLINLKTIYEVNIKDIYGIIRLRKNIKYYKYLILFLMINIVILILLSNIIFKVEVIHIDKDIRNLLYSELDSQGIKKYRFKKSYNQIQNIKKHILDKYNNIEWIEIESIGTKYIVRLETRKINKNNVINTKNNIVSNKNAIIKKIYLENGNIIKNINDYVSKDEVIISGEIYLNDILKDTINAKGKVFGEVWYEVNIEYPFKHVEIKELNNYRTVYLVKIFNREFGYKLNKFKDKKINKKVLLKSNLLPIYFIKQDEQEIIKTNYDLNTLEATNKALEYVKTKLNKEILDYKIIESTNDNNKLKLKIFYSVLEDITKYKEIEGEANVP